MDIHARFATPADHDHNGARDTLYAMLAKVQQPDSGRAVLAGALAKSSVANSATAALEQLNKPAWGPALQDFREFEQANSPAAIAKKFQEQMAAYSAIGQLRRIAAESLDWTKRLSVEIELSRLATLECDLRPCLQRMLNGLRHVKADDLTDGEADAAQELGFALVATDDALAQLIDSNREKDGNRPVATVLSRRQGSASLA